MNENFSDKNQNISSILSEWQKYIPLAVIFILLSNFVFNIGYFNNIGWKFLGLLCLADYYEGTTPYFVLTIFLFSCFIFYSLSIRIMPIFSSFVPNLFRFCKLAAHFFKNVISNKIKKNINNTAEFQTNSIDLKSRFRGLFGKSFFMLFCELMFTLFIFFLTAVTFVFIYIWSPILCYSFIILYILFLTFHYFIKLDKVKKIISYIGFYFIFIAFLGNFNYTQNTDKYNESFVILKENNTQYPLIRAMSKGAFIEDQNHIVFVKWEDIKFVEKINQYNSFFKDIELKYKKTFNIFVVK